LLYERSPFRRWFDGYAVFPRGDQNLILCFVVATVIDTIPKNTIDFRTMPVPPLAAGTSGRTGCSAEEIERTVSNYEALIPVRLRSEDAGFGQSHRFTQNPEPLQCGGVSRHAAIHDTTLRLLGVKRSDMSNADIQLVQA
jgi:hypothetical protein